MEIKVLNQKYYEITESSNGGNEWELLQQVAISIKKSEKVQSQ